MTNNDLMKGAEAHHEESSVTGFPGDADCQAKPLPNCCNEHKTVQFDEHVKTVSYEFDARVRKHLWYRVSHPVLQLEVVLEVLNLR